MREYMLVCFLEPKTDLVDDGTMLYTIVKDGGEYHIIPLSDIPDSDYNTCLFKNTEDAFDSESYEEIIKLTAGCGTYGCIHHDAVESLVQLENSLIDHLRAVDQTVTCISNLLVC
ncbi:hypothetical protein ACJU26_09815 [Acidithiobacillus sp. M4-SHS-6]|uniref:hypothetical protein n=1 Tax=Acidithiobacillus sp. M4-SHS-6 TaxID=3383024 RepID=UPI0039BDE70E